MTDQGLTFELFDQPGEPVAFSVDIGVVDLIGISGEDNLCSFAHPRDDRLHFQGSQVLRLIHHQKLMRRIAFVELEVSETEAMMLPVQQFELQVLQTVTNLVRILSTSLLMPAAKLLLSGRFAHTTVQAL